MKTTFGAFDPAGGDGFLRPVYFPSLATMDARTGDGRLLVGGGGSIYGQTLPRPIMAQFETGSGHDGAKVVGSLQEVTFHDDGNISGKGWLADVPDSHLLVTLAMTKSLFHNSVDLADVEYTAEWGSDDPDDPAFWDLNVDFTKYGLAATTFVNVPAFANAHGSLSEELTASATTPSLEPLLFRFETTELTIAAAEEITAAGDQPGEPFDAYHRPEPARLAKHTVDADGNVYGHLAPWGACHDGIAGRCVIAPKPANYSAFHQGTTLTDRGLVDTGLIFFLGGHPDRPLGTSDAAKAYGGVENAWAKIRVVNGRLGPWYCGRVITGLSPEALELARATPVSGHWRTDDTLAAIVSVNVRGYNIPGTDRTFDRCGASYDSNGRRHDLVASLHVNPTDTRPSAQEVFDMLGGINRWTNMTPIAYNTTSAPSTFTVADIAPIEPFDPPDTPALNRERLALELELELELDE